MTNLGIWVILCLGFVTIGRIYCGGVPSEVQLGGMDDEPLPQRPVLFTSPSEVKNYLDSLGKKISFSARQRYGKRSSMQTFRGLNAGRIEVPIDPQDDCNCERLKK